MGVDNRRLGELANIVEQMGLDITYAWDDIVFIEHGVFLFQFTDEPTQVKIHFVEDCTEEEKDKIIEQIEPLAKKEKMTVTYQGRFVLEQKEEDEMQLKFLA
jgi:hypothetical protein